MDISKNTKSKEEILFSELKNGQNAVFDYFFEKYYQGLCVYAVKITGSEAVSKDIVQDFFVRLWENRKNIDINASVKSYFIRSVHNRCLDYISHKDVKTVHKEYMLYHFKEEDMLEYPLLDFELKQKIMQEVDCLPAGIRETFILNRFDGLSYNEIAKEQGISVKTVEYRIGKALSSLQKSLSDYLFVVLL